MTEQTIIAFHQDEGGEWVAELACGHRRHMRHNPPWENRSWVQTEEGRESLLGHKIECRECINQQGIVKS